MASKSLLRPEARMTLEPVTVSEKWENMGERLTDSSRFSCCDVAT